MCDGGLLGRSEDKIGEVDFHFLRCWGKICLVFAVLLLAGLPISRSPVSTSHHIVGVLESHTDVYHLAFLFHMGLNSDGQAIAFICRAIPQAQSFVLIFLLAMVTFLSQLHCFWAGKGVTFHSEWRKENSLMERWESICKWRWESESWYQRSCESEDWVWPFEDDRSV